MVKKKPKRQVASKRKVEELGVDDMPRVIAYLAETATELADIREDKDSLSARVAELNHSMNAYALSEKEATEKYTQLLSDFHALENETEELRAWAKECADEQEEDGLIYCRDVNGSNDGLIVIEPGRVPWWLRAGLRKGGIIKIGRNNQGPYTFTCFPDRRKNKDRSDRIDRQDELSEIDAAMLGNKESSIGKQPSDDGN